MIALAPEDAQAVDLRAAAERTQTRRLLELQSSEARGSVSPLTQVLLTDLSEVSLTRLGADPLSRFDTAVGFMCDAPFFCEVDLDAKHILFSEKFVQAIEFAAAQAALVNIMNAIKRAFDAGVEDAADLKAAMVSAQTALHSLYMSRLTLHILDEAPLPNTAALLPERHKLFVHQQTALCLTFALLHEQAHLALSKHRDGRNEIVQKLPSSFVQTSPSEAQKEECLADIWAVRQVDGPARGTFLRAASFFFFNQWTIDYLTDLCTAEHPPAFNRIQMLMAAVPDLQESDVAFFSIMTDGLNQQAQLRTALNEKDQPTRYASLLKWCRSHLAYDGYEPLVRSLCQTYEEMGLHNQTITGRS
ncbi:hypothetical protein I5535_07015 [Rhodobacteraceae bacterium F11138]|nr:hypothetical protein [Rhodobacteraceae bacterium F11138]